MDWYVECINIGFLKGKIGWHTWTPQGIYGQITLGIVDVRAPDWDRINLVMVF